MNPTRACSTYPPPATDKAARRGPGLSRARASLPGTSEESTAIGNSHFVEAGSRVKVTLGSGEVVTGKVLQVLGSELVLSGDGNYGYSERSLSSSDIVAIEMEYTSSDDKKKNAEIVLLSVLALAIVACVGILTGLGSLN